MVVGLLPPAAGEVTIDGVSMSDPRQAQQRRKLRRRIQMIFQDPYASLNPRWRVDDIIAEPIRAFALIKANANPRAGRRAADAGRSHADDGEKYPHEFSGGQRQRIAIARALASSRIPRLRRADLGARRVGAGPDPQPDARPAGASSA